MRELDVAQDGRWAVGRDTRGYIHDYKRPAADIYRVNTTTGERTLMLKNQLIGSHVLGISPDGRHFLYWKDNKFQAYDLDAGDDADRSATATRGELRRHGVRSSRARSPSYGIAGYTSDGKSRHRRSTATTCGCCRSTARRRRISPTASARRTRSASATSRTEPTDAPARRRRRRRGRAAAARPRRASRSISSKPITLSAYGEYTKKAGFYELANGQLKELVYEDASFSTPTKATKAEKFLFTRQTFVEFPDLRVSGPGFKDAKKITDANPQQAEYLWGRRILFDYKNKDGMRLQGILALPDDYKPGEKRPMLVTFYEKNSQNLHRYNAPSYLTGMGSSPMEAVSRGYITMLPDIHFRTGSSHSDMLECVEAATRKVIEMGYVDPEAHRHHRPQLRRRRRGVHRHAVEAVRGGRHGRRRHRSVLRLQPELGLVVSGHRRQRRERQRLLPLRPGPLGLLAVGQPRASTASSRRSRTRRR